MNNQPAYTECKHCTYKLVSFAYRRAPWFRLVREPMIAGLRFLVFLHHADTSDFIMRTPACNGCIRFVKTALFPKSAVFRWLHARLNPIFNWFIRHLVNNEERTAAREYARRATEGTLSEEEIKAWMTGLKNTL